MLVKGAPGRRQAIIGCSIVNSILRNTFLYIDVIMSEMASQITSLTIVYSTVYSGEYQRKHQSSASLAFVREHTGDRWISHTKADNAENVSIWWRHHVSEILSEMHTISLKIPFANVCEMAAILPRPQCVKLQSRNQTAFGPESISAIVTARYLDIISFISPYCPKGPLSKTFKWHRGFI